MKAKTLRFKDTKEFAHVLEGGILGTSDIPDILPMTASMDALKKYYETIDPEKEVPYDILEVVEMDITESGEVGADIRNKLGPPKNLVALLTEYFDVPEVPDFQKLERAIRQEMNKTKECVEYLSKLF